MSRHIPYHARPLDPIKIDERPLPPGPCIAGIVLVSIALWWVVVWLVVHL